jgi:hypothetical protein
MALTINAKTYTADLFGTSAVGYVGSGHTVSVKDDVRLSRVAPKPTSTFSGVGRTSAKMTRTVTLTGSLNPSWDTILDVQVTVPVGMASADIDTLLNDMGAFLASASFKTHVKGQQISY